MIVSFFIYTIIVAATLALFEIQIEGKDGWAKNLPCWRIEKGWLVKVIGKRPLTGYHFFLIFVFLLMAHFPVFFSGVWSLSKEIIILGFLFLMFTIEDFLWFVFNPHFGFKKFRASNPDIWWHRWFLGLPDFYWITFPAGLILILIGYILG